MHRTRRIAVLAIALALVAAGCGGDDGSEDQVEAGEGPSATTEVAAPANPEGTFFVVRWQRDDTNPSESFRPGTTTSRLWELTPTCDGTEPCDLTWSGGGEGGSYDPPEFVTEDEPPADVELTYDADEGAWTNVTDYGAYGNCRLADGSYLDGDYTTMDDVDTMTLRWDGSGTRLVGTLTEEYTLNEAGRANPDCAPDSDETVIWNVLAVPQDDLEAAAADDIDLADEYVQAQEVYAAEGTDTVARFDTRIQLEPTQGDGACTAEACDATLTVYAGEDHDPFELELARDGDTTTAHYEGVDGCSSADSIRAGEPDNLTDEGYDTVWDVEVTPITLNEDGDQLLLLNGSWTGTPKPEAAAAFPDDCARTEVVSSYYYLIPSDLVEEPLDA